MNFVLREEFAFLFQTFSRNDLPGEAPLSRGRSVFKKGKKKEKEKKKKIECDLGPYPIFSALVLFCFSPISLSFPSVFRCDRSAPLPFFASRVESRAVSAP